MSNSSLGDPDNNRFQALCRVWSLLQIPAANPPLGRVENCKCDRADAQAFGYADCVAPRDIARSDHPFFARMSGTSRAPDRGSKAILDPCPLHLEDSNSFRWNEAL